MKHIFEDFIDNISQDIDDSQEHVTVTNEQKTYSHEYIVLSSFRTKEDVRNMIPHIRQICKTVFNMFSSCPLIGDFYGEIRTTDPYKDFGNWPQLSKDDLYRTPIDILHPEEIVQKCLAYMEDNKVKKSFLFDICVHFDYTVKALTYRQAFECLKLFAGIRDFIYDFSRKFCSSNVSQAITIDGERFNPRLDKGDPIYNEQLFRFLVNPTTDDERMKANEFVNKKIETMRNALNDNYSVPEELINQFSIVAPKFNPYWLAVCSIQISVDDEQQIMSAYVPNNVKVNFNIVQYLAYVFYQWNKRYHRNQYKIEIEVQGTLNVYKELGFLKHHASMVTYIRKLVLIGTPFKLLDTYLLPRTKVDDIEIVNPVFNTVGGDVQKYHVTTSMWMNKEINFTSKDYDISLQTEKNNMTYIVAKKK